MLALRSFVVDAAGAAPTNRRRPGGIQANCHRIMPRRQTHLAVGLLSGVGAGIVSGRHLPHDEHFLHVVFATIGGGVGGLAPDLLEPAGSPNHRDLFHSLLAAGVISKLLGGHWQSHCERASEQCLFRARTFPDGSTQRSNEEWNAILWRALAGFVAGFLAGYASHLALDAGTPTSLPVLINRL